MREFNCNCPRCKTTLLLKVQQQTLTRVTCPTCHLVFQVNVPSPAPSPAPALSPDYDPFTCELPLPNVPPEYAAGLSPSASGYYSGPKARSKKKRKKAGNNTGLWIAAGLAATFSLFVVVGGLVLYFMAGKPALPGASFASSLLNFDSAERISKDHLALRTEIEQLGRSIPPGDQSPAAAQLILEQLPKYDPLLERIYRLSPKAVTLDEYAHGREKQRAALEEWRQHNSSPQASHPGTDSTRPAIAPFWMVNSNRKPDDLVTDAINQLTLKDRSVTAVLEVMHVEYPDPRTAGDTAFTWTEQERNLLSLIHLRGLLLRDASRLLAQIESPHSPGKVTPQLHQAIDRYMEVGRNMRGMNIGKGMRGHLAFVPKGSPYEHYTTSAFLLFRQLRERLESRGELDSELKFAMDEVEAMQDAFEGMVFRVGAQHFDETIGSAQRYQDFAAVQTRAAQEHLLAEQRRVAEEQQRLEKAEQDQLDAEERRQREREERLANIQKGISNSPFGRNRPPHGGRFGRDGAGRRADEYGGPSQSGDIVEQRPATNDPSHFGSPFPPPSHGPPNIPMPPVDPAKRVTINATLDKPLDMRQFQRDMPQWLKQYPLRSFSSGNRTTITIENFDRPLEDLRVVFPMLEFESIDTQQRTIVAHDRAD